MAPRLTRTARIKCAGRVVDFPLPGWSLEFGGGGGGHRRFLCVGNPDFRSPPHGWRYVEQMGSTHTLVGAGVVLLVSTRKRRRWFTELALSTSPATGTTR